MFFGVFGLNRFQNRFKCSERQVRKKPAVPAIRKSVSAIHKDLINPNTTVVNGLELLVPSFSGKH